MTREKFCSDCTGETDEDCDEYSQVSFYSMPEYKERKKLHFRYAENTAHLRNSRQYNITSADLVQRGGMGAPVGRLRIRPARV
jgi:hypothetical protein